MNALVIGAGKSGIGAALLLHQQGYDITLVNRGFFSEQEYLESLGIVVSTDDLNMELVKDYDLVIKNPGIPNDHPLVSKFDGVLNEIEIAYLASPSYTYYAISGANGKTTTTSILGAMLQRKNSDNIVAGNIGTALSQVVYGRGDHKLDVALEISAFQMEGTPSVCPEVYAITNLTPDHLDRYDSVDDYYRQKLSLVDRASYFIRNIDDANILNLTEKKDNTLDISIHKSADIYIKDNNAYFKDTLMFIVSDVKVVGSHNLMNILMASAMAFIAGVSLEDIQGVVRNFKGVEHRLEFVQEINGVRYYNDSKSTNPESLEVALNAFDTPIILLAGGYDKHVSFKSLEDFGNKIKQVYLFGESAEQMKQEAFNNAILVSDLNQALNLAKKQAKQGDSIVLSPGCASYDQFENFEQRGIIFKELVMK